MVDKREACRLFHDPSPVPEAPPRTIRRDPRSSTHRDDGSPLQAGYGHEVFCGGCAPHKPLIRFFCIKTRALNLRGFFDAKVRCIIALLPARSPRWRSPLWDRLTRLLKLPLEFCLSSFQVRDLQLQRSVDLVQLTGQVIPVLLLRARVALLDCRKMIDLIAKASYARCQCAL